MTPVRITAVGLDRGPIFAQLDGLLAHGCELVGIALKSRRVAQIGAALKRGLAG